MFLITVNILEKLMTYTMCLHMIDDKMVCGKMFHIDLSIMNLGYRAFDILIIYHWKWLNQTVTVHNY